MLRGVRMYARHRLRLLPLFVFVAGCGSVHVLDDAGPVVDDGGVPVD